MKSTSHCSFFATKNEATKNFEANFSSLSFFHFHETTKKHSKNVNHHFSALFFVRHAKAMLTPMIISNLPYFCAMKLLFAALLITLTSATVLQTTKPAVALLSAQNTYMCGDTLNPQAGQANGDVQIVVDSSITKLEKSLRGFRDIKGYRVQIFLGTAEAVKNERNKYLGLGLPYSAYMKQVVPEYSLVIGDFKSRMELEKHLQIIQQHYPKAFAVNDVIEIKKSK